MVRNRFSAHPVRRRIAARTAVGHSVRRIPRRAALAAASLVAALGWTTPAVANEYTINACQADRTNYSTHAFEDFATRGMCSPKGGVGKTTSTFLAGNVLASHLKLRAIAVDANPAFGTLGRLPAERARAARSLVDLLDASDRLGSAAELRPYVARLPSGLHLLAAPHDTTPTTSLVPDRYGEVVALLSCFYETVLLDLGTGVAGPIARLFIGRADQVVLVTTLDELTANLAVDALNQLDPPRTTVVVNRAHPRLAPEVRTIEDFLRQRGVHRTVVLPEDPRLALMLDSGTYSLAALDRRTRVPVKQLGLAVADRLV